MMKFRKNVLAASGNSARMAAFRRRGRYTWNRYALIRTVNL
jgi:hypothetical protein